MDLVQFSISRKAAFAGALLPYRIHINGQYVGTLLNGQTLTVDVPRTNAYYIEDDAFSKENAIIYDNGQRQRRILLKRIGGWRTVSYTEFHVEQDGKFVQAPSYPLDRLYAAILEDRMDALSPNEQVLAFCLEFEYAIQDGLQTVLASENLFSITSALQKVGADQYADLLQNVIRVDFSDVKFPISHQQAAQLRGRIERADEMFQNNASASAALHRGFVRYLLANLAPFPK